MYDGRRCFGRKDYQIKLNGFRIELGEIENAILLTGMVEAIVVSVGEINGKRQLVAFCIFKGNGGSSSKIDQKKNLHDPQECLDSVRELVESLTSIAHYMMPSIFLPFTGFPTLPSGKANRKELVKLAENMTKAEISAYMTSTAISHKVEAQELVPVSSREQEVMQEAWAAVLSEPVDSIGANSNFFDLGGDSIAAINVVAECRELSFSIGVGQVLASPILSEQASHMKPVAGGKVKTLKPVEYNIPQSVFHAIEEAGLDQAEIEDIYPCGPGQVEFLTQGKDENQFWNLTACRAIPEEDRKSVV